MATTTNYGWTTPDDTALVKDGASAIRTLGSSIDTSLNTALGTKKAGLVLLNTTSFSAVASQSINSVFTSTYKNYKIYISLKNAADADITFRLRASGTDLTSNSYYEGRIYTGETSSLALGSTNAVLGSSWILNSPGTWASSMIMDISNPQATEVTNAVTISSARFAIYSGQSLNNVTTSYDGFTIISASTMTGQVSVYGYNV